MRAKRVAPSDEPTNDSAAEAASPASFQPRNAHTSAGALRPSGRLSQIKGCIRITVHHADVTASQVHNAFTLLPSPSGGPPRLVATLRAGDDVDAVFACARKERLMTRGGDPYLAVELPDRSGAIQARAFRNADLLAGQFERGQLVHVRGRVARFREALHVEITATATAHLPEA